MADKSVIFTLIAKDSASAAIKGVEGSMHGLRGAAGGLTGALGGVGGALTSLPALIGGAGVTAALVGMTKAAADDEAAQKRLLAAAMANVPGWDGNASALNDAIKASQDLAFTDDEARDSLTRLLTSTHDVSEATKLNAAAMDLARLKGIPLSEAANIIGKVHDGNIGILSRYGIAVGKGADATSALAAIQAASQGQAQTYGDTTAGGMDKLGIAVGELGESIGTLFLPIMQGLVDVLNTTVIPAISGVVDTVKGWFSANGDLTSGLGAGLSGALKSVGDMLTPMLPTIQNIAQQFGDFATMVITQLIPTLLDLVARVWNGGLGSALSTFAELGGRIYGALTQVFTTILTNQDVMNVLRTAADLLGGALKVVADFARTVFDKLGELFGAITSNKEVMSGLEAVVKGIWTGLQSFAGFATDVAGAIGRVFSAIITNKTITDTFKSVVGAIVEAFRIGAGFIDAFLQALTKVWEFIQNNPIADALGALGAALPKFATGGYTAAGSAMVVGERGPELFIPRAAGSIITNAALRAGGGVIGTAEPVLRANQAAMENARRKRFGPRYGLGAFGSPVVGMGGVAVGQVTINVANGRGFDPNTSARDFYDAMDREGRRRGYLGIGRV